MRLPHVFLILFLGSINIYAGIKGQGLSVEPLLSTTDSMPSEECEIIARYHDSEGRAIPVIFKGAALTWGISKWSPEFFAQEYGYTTVYASPKDIFDVGPDPDLSRGVCRPLKKTTQPYIVMNIVELMLNDEENAPYYQMHVPNSWDVPSLKDVTQGTAFPLLDHRPREHYLILMGPRGTVASLHNHHSTFLAQLYGEKQITMIAPEYAEAFECVPEKFRPQHVNYCLDPLEIDLFEYPALEGVKIFQGILEAGDVLYIPDSWLHDIRALSPSISLARWGR